jgi:hypothetical protein
MRSTHRMLGALLAVLALSVTAVASASAATPEWYYHGHALSAKPAEGGLGAGEETISASGGPFKLTVPSVNIAFECKSASLTHSKIAALGLGSGEALSMKECAYTGGGHCVVPRNIATGSVRSELFYVRGTEVWAQYKPTGGGTLATIALTECAAEGLYQLNGSFCGKETSPSTETVMKNEVFGTSPTGEGARECGLHYFGTNAAKLEGTLALSLTGSQLGSIWTGK